MVDFELELETEYPWRVGCENSLSLTMNLTFSPDLSPHSYRQITRMEDRDVVYNIQFSSGAEETRVPFNTENFRRALGAFPSLSGQAIQYINHVYVRVTALNCQVQWVASIVKELCAWQKLVLRDTVEKYILRVSASTLENLSPSQLYQTSIANVVQRVAQENFCRYTYLRFEREHPGSESLSLQYNSTLNTISTVYFRFNLICEHWSKHSELHMDFPCFRRFVFSAFAIALMSSSGMHAILKFNFRIVFHICNDCSPLITSVVAYILNILADCHSFLPCNYNPYHKCWMFNLFPDRTESSSYSLQNLVERHFLNFFVRDRLLWGELILQIPFPQTMESIKSFTENELIVGFTASGTPRSRLFPKPWTWEQIDKYFSARLRPCSCMSCTSRIFISFKYHKR